MPLVTVNEVDQNSFDYIVVGGGTAGLTLAQRVSEDPNVSVLVLEAGASHEDDVMISRPGLLGAHIGNPTYDWLFKTVPQPNAKDREIGWTRGKLLGGSSAINFMAWSMPHKDDCDTWEKLGNPGFNHDTYLKHAHKNINFHARTQEGIDQWEYKAGNKNGDRNIAFPPTLLDIELKFIEALQSLGVPLAQKPLEGDHLGTHLSPNTLDPTRRERVHSGSIYFDQGKNRNNLIVLTQAYATRVVVEEQNGEIVATGVEFTVGDDKEDIKLAKANKEVVLAAGAPKTPQILELSGIGRKAHLDKIGVSHKLELPVGENVQDHLFVGMSWQLKDDTTETFEILLEPEKAAAHLELLPQDKGVFNMGIAGFTYYPLSKMASEKRAKELQAEAAASVRERIKNGRYKDAEAATLEAQINKHAQGIPDCEIISFPAFWPGVNPPRPGKKHLSVFCLVNHPLSRGTVHAPSSDPHADPEIDPHYLEEDWDLNALVEVFKFARSVGQQSPLKELISEEINPGPKVQTNEEITDWARSTVSPAWHTIGSTSMLPKDKGGVVDTNLKVYGTKNIRVADVGVLPLHMAAHTQAAAYAIGEYGADIIKKGHQGVL